MIYCSLFCQFTRVKNIESCQQNCIIYQKLKHNYSYWFELLNVMPTPHSHRQVQQDHGTVIVVSLKVNINIYFLQITILILNQFFHWLPCLLGCYLNFRDQLFPPLGNLPFQIMSEHSSHMNATSTMKMIA